MNIDAFMHSTYTGARAHIQQRPHVDFSQSDPYLLHFRPAPSTHTPSRFMVAVANLNELINKMRDLLENRIERNLKVNATCAFPMLARA